MVDLNALYAEAVNSPTFMFAIGAATAHADVLVHYGTIAVFKVPFLRAWLMGNPQQALAKLDKLYQEVRADMQAIAQNEQDATAQEQPAAPPPKGPAAS